MASCELGEESLQKGSLPKGKVREKPTDPLVGVVKICHSDGGATYQKLAPLTPLSDPTRENLLGHQLGRWVPVVTGKRGHAVVLQEPF